MAVRTNNSYYCSKYPWSCRNENTSRWSSDDPKSLIGGSKNSNQTKILGSPMAPIADYSAIIAVSLLFVIGVILWKFRKIF